MPAYHSVRRSVPECVFRVAVIGAGNVGATAAYALLLDGTPTHLHLLDVNRDRAEGVILDMEHSLPLLNNVELSAGDDFAAIADANVVVVTAGARQLQGETRLDLLEKNRAVFRQIIPRIAAAAPQAILIIVTNPVDVLTQFALELSGFPESRVFGTGTMLDTMRFRYHLAQKAKVSPHSINSFILGEHGDGSFPLLSSARIAGTPLLKWPGLTAKVIDRAYKDTQQAAYKIINDIGFTCYSIATVITKIVSHIFEDAREAVPLSVSLDRYYSRKRVSLSVPCLLGRQGVIRQIKSDLSRAEWQKLEKAAEMMNSLRVRV